MTKEGEQLWGMALETIRELETERGILASARTEAYGCVFGRDSLITALALLRVYDHTSDTYLLGLVQKILLHLAELQGKEYNIESGEEPGKCIHEFRPDGHEHLTKHEEHPWYLYPDNIMRNYDSVDATPLFLIAVYRYWQRSHDDAFLNQLQENTEAALHWLLRQMSTSSLPFVYYRVAPERISGGLVTQSWMDSAESVFHEDGDRVTRPVAAVEVQAYAFLALTLWSRVPLCSSLSEQLQEKAREVREAFNIYFVNKIGRNGEITIATGIDGTGKRLTAARSSIGHCLWASLTQTFDGEQLCVLGIEHIPKVVERLLRDDLFVPNAGIRTLSGESTAFRANSYHNGSIWPHDNSMIVEGLENWGYEQEAHQVRTAILQAITHFKTPIELFVHEDGLYKEYRSARGSTACLKQAWCAASILKEVVSSI